MAQRRAHHRLPPPWPVARVLQRSVCAPILRARASPSAFRSRIARHRPRCAIALSIPSLLKGHTLARSNMHTPANTHTCVRAHPCARARTHTGSWPEYCDDKAPFNMTALADLVDDLHMYWPSLVSPDQSSFWAHEVSLSLSAFLPLSSSVTPNLSLSQSHPCPPLA